MKLCLLFLLLFASCATSGPSRARRPGSRQAAAALELGPPGPGARQSRHRQGVRRLRPDQRLVLLLGLVAAAVRALHRAHPRRCCRHLAGARRNARAPAPARVDERSPVVGVRVVSPSAAVRARFQTARRAHPWVLERCLHSAQGPLGAVRSSSRAPSKHSQSAPERASAIDNLVWDDLSQSDSFTFCQRRQVFCGLKTAGMDWSDGQGADHFRPYLKTQTGLLATRFGEPGSPDGRLKLLAKLVAP
jgi:hypothetical protein